MRTEGFTAGVAPGGLHQMADVGLLLCYILSSTDEPLPRAILTEIVVGNGMANYFDTTEAIENLISVGSVQQSDDAEQCLSVSETGRVAVQTLQNRLPRTLRERSVSAAVQALSRRRNERDTTVTVTELSHGCSISCAIKDEEAPLMSFSLKLGDALQADYVRNRFLDNPELLYRSMIAILTGQVTVDEESGKTTVHLP